MKRKRIYVKSATQINTKLGKLHRQAKKQIKHYFSGDNRFSKLLYGCSEFDTSWLIFGWKHRKNDLTFYFENIFPNRKIIKQCRNIASKQNREAFFYFYFPDRGGVFESLVLFGVKFLIKKGMEELVKYIISDSVSIKKVKKIVEYEILKTESGILIDIIDERQIKHQFKIEFEDKNFLENRKFELDLNDYLIQQKSKIEIYNKFGYKDSKMLNKIDIEV